MRTAIILLLVILICLFVAKRISETKSSPAQPAGQKSVTMSKELEQYLFEPYTHLRIDPPQDIRAYTRDITENGLPRERKLRYVIDPDVQGKVGVFDARDVTWASILDEFCKNNGCKWEVADPYTIHISSTRPK